MKTVDIPQEKNVQATPKDFFLWVGAMVAFYVNVVAFVSLIFEYINYGYPDPLVTFPIDPYQSGISGYMATVIVALPIFLVLMRVIRRSIEVDPTRQEVWVRRWALVCTLFVTAVAIAITLIVLLMTFLNGEEITVRFLLKIVTVLLVAGTSFVHFFVDIKGYWKRFPDRARMVGFGIVGLVAVAIVAGFFIVGTPQDARRARTDAQRVRDLESIQWQIVSYWQQKKELPASLGDLADSISNFSAPVDPETKNGYEYRKTEVLKFALCATFNRENRSISDMTRPAYPYPAGGPGVTNVITGGKTDSWQHGAGRVCFDRSIDPDRYPPNTVPVKM